MCTIQRSIKTLSKALDAIKEDFPHLDMDDYVRVDSFDFSEEMDEFIYDIHDIGCGDSGEEVVSDD
eukprot:2376074-Prymnesium_polylepis.1